MSLKILDKTNVSNDDFISEYEKRQVFLYGQRIMLEREFELGGKKAKHEIAKKALQEGLDIATIEKLTGLTEEEILAMNN